MKKTSSRGLFLVSAFYILTSSASWAKVEAVIGGTPLEKNPNVAIGIPETDNSEILISRDQYLISYNKNRRAPNWVSWELDPTKIGNAGRTNKFQQDRDLENYLIKEGEGRHAVKPTEYTKSCFDRGHQIPSGDRTDTPEDNATTFMMSNMIPQTPYLNQVRWEHLEAYTRDLVQRQNKKAYVIAGPVYDIDFGAIGPNGDIPVPSKDFKIIFILDRNQSPADINGNTPLIAVMMPNTLKSGEVPVPNTAGCAGRNAEMKLSGDWQQFETTLEEIEAKSDLTFQNLTFMPTHHSRRVPPANAPFSEMASFGSLAGFITSGVLAQP